MGDGGWNELCTMYIFVPIYTYLIYGVLFV